MYKNGERMMAWVASVNEVSEIPNADTISAYRVGGWWVVDKKGAYNVGDLCVYISIDSWVPTEIAPFLSKGKEPREYNGIRGERLRTVKLRGQVSQGLIIPAMGTFSEGTDMTAALGIQKWELPMPAELIGSVEGLFPTVIPKTDQERIQNLTEELKVWQGSTQFTWEVTEKLDGSSMTVFVNGNDQGVCSRNWNLKETEGNSMWRVARDKGLIHAIRRSGCNLALQGEIIGEGIQGNPYGLKGQDFYLFDIYDIDRGEYLTPVERRVFADEYMINHVPVFAKEMVIHESMQGLLTMAEGKSRLNSKTEREGFVFKCNTFGGPTFKVISNKFLLKGGE